MDPFRRNRPLNPQPTSNGSELKRRKDPTTKVAETDENEFPSLNNGVPSKSQDLKTDPRKNASFSNTSSFKKKILAERKQEDLLPDSYDPITNYTSPRPKFLRYNPNQRRELLQRIEAEKRGDEEEEVRDNDFEEGEESEEKKPFYSYVVWSLLLIFGALLFIVYCTSSSNPSFEEKENPAANIHKIHGKTPLRLVGRNLFPENLGSSIGESLCNFDENFFVSLEIDGIGRELSDEPEVRDLLLKNGGVDVDDSAATEKMEHGDQSERDFGPSAISRAESLEENNSSSSSSVESLLVSVVQDVSDSLSTIREDDHNASSDSMEILSISQSRSDDSTPPNDQDFNFKLVSDTEREPDDRSSILSEGVVRAFSIFLGSLTVVVGLFSSFHKYFQRPKLNSLHVVVPSPPSKTETGEKIVINAPMEERNLEKALDISVESNSRGLNSVSSTYDQMNVELKEVSGFGQPRVELLGEFSLIDAGVTNNGFDSYLRKMENPNSQFSYYQKGKERKRLSPSSDMLYSSPEASTSSRFSSKVPADKGEISDTSATSSLRRSSRLRNRNRVI